MTPNSVTIMWATSGSSQVHGWVQYGTEDCSMEAFQYDRGLKQAFTRIYRVKLENLQPSTTYYYKAVIREITGFVGNTSLTWGDKMETDVYSFTTPSEDADQVSCLIFNDVHSNDSFVKSLVDKNNLSFTNSDFVFFNGDMLNSLPSESEIIDHMLSPYSQLFASKLPFFAVRGNHEYRNKYARHWFDYVQAGKNNDGYYAFTWGPCFFIVLDTGEDKEDSHAEYNGLLDCEAYRSSQVAWLETQLNSEERKKAAFTVVFMHIPFYSNTSTARFSVGDCRRLFMPMMNDSHVDLVISGHTHKAGVINPDTSHSFPIVIGGGKDVTEEKKTYCPAVITLKADRKKLNVDILDWYGENRGSVTLNK
ncbi:MAG: metallophosphoesterase family protein [Paludibacteraceae bacterium]|nr:metallophosphoesterase family protein [Paludibacteraceae bacterium]